MAGLKKIRRAVRRPFETAGYKLLALIVPLLPRCTIVGFSMWAGRMAWLLPLREKRIGIKNLDAIFGDTKTNAEKRIILTTSIATFVQTMLDVFWFSKNPEKRIPRYVELDPSFRPLFQSKAHICITAHFGNWEVISQTLTLKGIHLASIAATVKNPTVNRILIEHREKTGQIIIPQKGALRTLIARLRNKEKVAFVLDQNTTAENGGIRVDFLGLPMSVSSAPAMLAYRTGTEIFFGLCMPMKKGKYRIYSPGTLQPPVFEKTNNAGQVAKELTQKIQDVLSEEILAHPEYWLWSYKHWRRVKGTEPHIHYPDY